MRCVVGCVAALVCAAGVGHGSENENTAAKPDAEASPRVMYFSGIDVWRHGAFAHGGLLWSPDGLFREGFTLKVLGATGTYRYMSGGLGDVEVTGQHLLGAFMPGWRFKWDKLELTLFAGLDLQNHRLLPDDPFGRLRGTYAGLRAGADLWYEPLSAMMLAANASVSSIGPNYWTRAATGWRVLDKFWLGPEALALGDLTYQQYRLGAHVTGFKTKRFEWSAGAGWVTDTDRRRGFYGRVGVLMRR
jgi:hypothetical protein